MSSLGEEEYIDYSCSTPMERLSRDIETQLRRWHIAGTDRHVSLSVGTSSVKMASNKSGTMPTMNPARKGIRRRSTSDSGFDSPTKDRQGLASTSAVTNSNGVTLAPRTHFRGRGNLRRSSSVGGEVMDLATASSTTSPPLANQRLLRRCGVVFRPNRGELPIHLVLSLWDGPAPLAEGDFLEEESVYDANVANLYRWGKDQSMGCHSMPSSPRSKSIQDNANTLPNDSKSKHTHSNSNNNNNPMPLSLQHHTPHFQESIRRRRTTATTTTNPLTSKIATDLSLLFGIGQHVTLALSQDTTPRPPSPDLQRSFSSIRTALHLACVGCHCRIPSFALMACYDPTTTDSCTHLTLQEVGLPMSLPMHHHHHHNPKEEACPAWLQYGNLPPFLSPPPPPQRPGGPSTSLLPKRRRRWHVLRDAAGSMASPVLRELRRQWEYWSSSRVEDEKGTRVGTLLGYCPPGEGLYSGSGRSVRCMLKLERCSYSPRGIQEGPFSACATAAAAAAARRQAWRHQAQLPQDGRARFLVEDSKLRRVTSMTSLASLGDLDAAAAAAAGGGEKEEYCDRSVVSEYTMEVSGGSVAHLRPTLPKDPLPEDHDSSVPLPHERFRCLEDVVSYFLSTVDLHTKKNKKHSSGRFPNSFSHSQGLDEGEKHSGPLSVIVVGGNEEERLKPTLHPYRWKLQDVNIVVEEIVHAYAWQKHPPKKHTPMPSNHNTREGDWQGEDGASRLEEDSVCVFPRPHGGGGVWTETDLHGGGREVEEDWNDEDAFLEDPSIAAVLSPGSGKKRRPRVGKFTPVAGVLQQPQPQVALTHWRDWVGVSYFASPWQNFARVAVEPASPLSHGTSPPREMRGGVWNERMMLQQRLISTYEHLANAKPSFPSRRRASDESVPHEEGGGGIESEAKGGGMVLLTPATTASKRAARIRERNLQKQRTEKRGSTTLGMDIHYPSDSSEYEEEDDDNDDDEEELEEDSTKEYLWGPTTDPLDRMHLTLYWRAPSMDPPSSPNTPPTPPPTAAALSWRPDASDTLAPCPLSARLRCVFASYIHASTLHRDVMMHQFVYQARPSGSALNITEDGIDGYYRNNVGRNTINLVEAMVEIVASATAERRDFGEDPVTGEVAEVVRFMVQDIRNVMQYGGLWWSGLAGKTNANTDKAGEGGCSPSRKANAGNAGDNTTPSTPPRTPKGFEKPPHPHPMDAVDPEEEELSYSSPMGGLLSLLCFQMMSHDDIVKSPISMCRYWLLFVEELRDYWHQGMVIPNLGLLFHKGWTPGMRHGGSGGAAKGTEAGLSSTSSPCVGKRPGQRARHESGMTDTVDRSCCLLEQKLQVINLGIESVASPIGRKRRGDEEAGKEVTSSGGKGSNNEDADEDDKKPMCSVSFDPEQPPSAASSTTSSKHSIDGEDNDDDDDNEEREELAMLPNDSRNKKQLLDTSEHAHIHKPAKNTFYHPFAPTRLESVTTFAEEDYDTAEEEDMDEDGSILSTEGDGDEGEEQVKRRGTRCPVLGVLLRSDGSQLYEPYLQRREPMTTEAWIQRRVMMARQEQHDTRDSRGSSRRSEYSSQALKGRLQIAHHFQRPTLLSDMQAFKAANPGAMFEDFIDWYGNPSNPLEDYDAAEGDEDDEALLALQQEDGIMEIPSKEEIENRRTPRSKAKREAEEQRRSALEAVEILNSTRDFWADTWKKATPLAAAEQPIKLFDAVQEVEGVLHFLQSLHPSQMLNHVLAVNLSTSSLLLSLMAGHARQVRIVDVALKRLHGKTQFALSQLMLEYHRSALAVERRDETFSVSPTTLVACEAVCNMVGEVEVLLARATSLLHKFPGEFELVQNLLLKKENEEILLKSDGEGSTPFFETFLRLVQQQQQHQTDASMEHASMYGGNAEMGDLFSCGVGSEGFTTAGDRRCSPCPFFREYTLRGADRRKPSQLFAQIYETENPKEKNSVLLAVKECKVD